MLRSAGFPARRRTMKRFKVKFSTAALRSFLGSGWTYASGNVAAMHWTFHPSDTDFNVGLRVCWTIR